MPHSGKPACPRDTSTILGITIKIRHLQDISGTDFSRQ
jgi:hypothetical protein